MKLKIILAASVCPTRHPQHVRAMICSASNLEPTMCE